MLFSRNIVVQFGRVGNATLPSSSIGLAVHNPTTSLLGRPPNGGDHIN